MNSVKGLPPPAGSSGARRGFWVRVPGSTSNLGPGFDALGMAVDAVLEATWEETGGPLHVTRSGMLERAPWAATEDLVVRVLDETTARIANSDSRISEPARDRTGLTGALHLRSDIPLGKGLGSSAAARVAGVLLGRLLAVATADRHQVLREAAALEGHPDNAAPAVLGGLVAAHLDDDGEVTAVPLPLSLKIAWVFAAPGVGLATERARRALPQTVPHATAIRNSARLALLIPALAAGDGPLLARAMEDELHVPHRLPLIPGAAEAVDAAREAGAWGATLSGAGSGLIAAVPPGSEAAVGEAMAASFEKHPEALGGTWRVLRPWLAGAQWGSGPLKPRGPERFATSRG